MVTAGEGRVVGAVGGGGDGIGGINGNRKNTIKINYKKRKET